MSQFIKHQKLLEPIFSALTRMLTYKDFEDWSMKLMSIYPCAIVLKSCLHRKCEVSLHSKPYIRTHITLSSHA